jgi:hypothetical protein
MDGMSKKANTAMERIAELERRVRELEARPIYWPQPIVIAPSPPAPWYPALPQLPVTF